MNQDMVIIGQCSSNVEAKILKSFFEANGILCHIQGEDLYNTPSMRFYMNVMVPDFQKEEAFLLFKEFKNSMKGNI